MIEQALLPQFFALRKNGTTERRSATAFSGPVSNGTSAASAKKRRSLSALALSTIASAPGAHVAKAQVTGSGHRKRKVSHISAARLEELSRPRAATFLIACQMASARLLSRSRVSQKKSNRDGDGENGGGGGRPGGMSSAQGRQEQFQDALDLDYAMAKSPFVQQAQQRALKGRRARSAHEYGRALTRARSFCRALDAERKSRMLSEALTFA